MEDHLGVMLLDELEDMLVVVDLQLGIEAALEQYLYAALVDRVFNLGEDFLVAVEISLITARGAVERAELASDPADVGVVENPPDDISHHIVRCLLQPLKVGQRTKFQQVLVVEEEERVLRCNSLPSINLLGNRLDRDARKAVGRESRHSNSILLRFGC